MLLRVLLAVDRAEQRKRLRKALSQPDVVVETVTGRNRLWERISTATCDVIVVSESLIPEPVAETVALLQELPESPGVVVVSEAEPPLEHAALLAAGVGAVVYADLPEDTLQGVLAAILEKRVELAQKELVIDTCVSEPRLSDFVSESSAMQAFMHVVQRVVASDTTLLFQGETGVGKERLARAIHAESPRAEGPFISVNCGALPESLLESELFGHEEGSFTGATRARRGWFELAHRGTILLDEVGDLAPPLQVKLLRVLQDRQIQRVGSEKALAVDVRVMAASNLDLEEEVDAKRFRRDLYYRLSVVTLTIPPLRQRTADIPTLAQSYVNYFRSRISGSVTGIDDEAMRALMNYSWPGNVRELMNVVERAMLLCEGEELSLADLPDAIRVAAADTGVPPAVLARGDDWPIPPEWLAQPLSEVREDVIQQFERSYLKEQLRATLGRVGEAAKRAGIQPRSLFDKMRRYGLKKEDFRA